MSLLGIDIGSSNVKGAAYSVDGILLAHAEREYTTIRSQAGWAELDSKQVVEETKNIIREIASRTKGDPIQAIAFSSLGEAMTPIPKIGKFLVMPL